MDEVQPERVPHFADAEEIVIAETGRRFFRVHGGRHDRRWSPTEATATEFLTDARVFALGTVEIER